MASRKKGKVTAMCPPATTWTERVLVSGTPEEILELLTEPEAIARWAPVPFEIVELAEGRLVAGGRARVRGRLAGRAVDFTVDVLQADERCLALVADGPISLDVDYSVSPRDEGSELRASVSVRGSGLMGRVAAAATTALLAGGALASSIGRLERELGAAPAH
jgi:Polyketide cyclase / dehydrase and lipid transport